MKKRIGIDCRLAGVRHAGIGRYTQNIVRRLPLLRTEIIWVLFFSDYQQVEEVFGKTVPVNVELVIAPVKHYSLAEQLQMPGIFSAHKLDLLHVPHFNIPLFYSGKVIVTIHDLLWHEYRGLDVTTLSPWLYHLKYLGYKTIVSSAVRKAQKILVPTETISQTLQRFYPDARKKIVVTHEGVDADLLHSRQEKAAPSAEKRSKKLLYLGSLYPHKNVRFVIDALRDLPDYSLWIVGTRSAFQRDLQKYVIAANLEQRVRFLGYVPDEKLPELFADVEALVQPSLSEGFGLTGLEAMALELPVLAADTPIFHEVYQDGAIFFDPHSVKSFQTAAQHLHEMPTKELELLLRHGQKIAATYDWQRTAQETFAAYTSVLGQT